MNESTPKKWQFLKPDGPDRPKKMAGGVLGLEIIAVDWQFPKNHRTLFIERFDSLHQGSGISKPPVLRFHDS